MCVTGSSMAEFDINQLASLEWMQSRIPALDALVGFVPDGPRDAEVDAFSKSHRSRWYPLPGGFRVVIPMESNSVYDTTKWKIETGAWNHEHCNLCAETIPAMTLCWVTEYGPYVLLCDACHAK